MFEDQPVFYVTKGCRLAMPPRPKKIKNKPAKRKTSKKLAKKGCQKRKQHMRNRLEKQREKMAQIAEQGKEEIDRSHF